MCYGSQRLPPSGDEVTPPSVRSRTPTDVNTAVVESLRLRLAETEARLQRARAREAELSKKLLEMKRFVSVMEILESYLKRRFLDQQRQLALIISHSPISPKACKYFDWVDPELPPEYDCYKKLIFDMKQKLGKKADYAQIAKLEEKVNKLKFKRACDKLKLDSFIVELGIAKADGERVKKQLFWTRAVVVAFVVFFIAWFVIGH